MARNLLGIMMKFLLVLSISNFLYVKADIDEVVSMEENSDSNSGESSGETTVDDVDTLPIGLSSYLLNGNDNNIHAGELVICAFNVENKGEEPMILYSAHAALYNPESASHLLHNFSVRPHYSHIHPNSVNSFLHMFWSSEHFIDRDFILVIQASIYNSTGSMFNKVVFNETISFTERPKIIDVQMTFLGFLFFGSIFACLYFFVYLKYKHKLQITQTKRLETGTKDDIDYTWIPKDTIQKKKSLSRKSVESLSE